eukprot:25949-Alexandrium_andersonii.AAC.1
MHGRASDHSMGPLGHCGAFRIGRQARAQETSLHMHMHTSPKACKRKRPYPLRPGVGGTRCGAFTQDGQSNKRSSP